MKQLLTFMLLAMICSTANAQNETTEKNSSDSSKTVKKKEIRIGNVTINVMGDKSKGDTVYYESGKHKKIRIKHPNLTTNWGVLDLGFSNYIDNTNYGSTGASLINQPLGGVPALGESDFKLVTGKSINVNIWFFMQRLNLVKHKLNLKYGLGLELNNYRYKTSSRISYSEGGVIPYTYPPAGISQPFIFRDSIVFTKNKLAADYLTVPLMLNFNSNPKRPSHGLNISAGISAGYLYSERNKQKSAIRGKRTNKGEYNLERFKFSYVGEIGMGSVRLYGSYSPTSMYEKDLNMRPFTIGLRFSNW